MTKINQILHEDKQKMKIRSSANEFILDTQRRNEDIDDHLQNIQAEKHEHKIKAFTMKQLLEYDIHVRGKLNKARRRSDDEMQDKIREVLQHDKWS